MSDERVMKLRDRLPRPVLEQLTPFPSEAAKATDSPSLAEVLQAFYLDQEVGERSPRTIGFYRQYFDQFLKMFPSLDGKPFTDIKIEHLQKFLLSKGDAVYAKNAAYRSFRALFYFAERRRFIRENIIRQMRPPKLPKDTGIPVIKKDDFKRLLKTCGPTFLGLRDRAVMVLLYDTGLRLSELVGMAFSNLNLENMEIRVLGKGNKRRVVSFDESVRRDLVNYLNLHPLKTDVVWLTEEKTPIKNSGIEQMIARRSRSIGMERCHPHMFRHSCAVNLLQSGMDIDSISKYLGQEGIAVLLGYLKSLKSQNASELHKKHSPMRNLDL